MIDALLARLRSDEGLRLFPYMDTTGHITIGYGRNLSERGISQGEADALLQRDALNAIRECEQAFPWFGALSEARQVVIASMVFNMGLSGVRGFGRMLDAVQRRDFATASAEMLHSQWATQVGARADRLAVMMRNG